MVSESSWNMLSINSYNLLLFQPENAAYIISLGTISMELTAIIKKTENFKYLIDTLSV